MHVGSGKEFFNKLSGTNNGMLHGYYDQNGLRRDVEGGKMERKKRKSTFCSIRTRQPPEEKKAP